MPIDNIKTKDTMLANPEGLEFEFTTNQQTGEIRPIEVAEYDGLKFIRKGGKTFLRGSLHKYFNNGLHNYNDFRYIDLLSVLDGLETKFGKNLLTARLENVEFGVNLVLPYSPNRVINSLVLHRGQPYLRMSRGKGVECEHSQYCIKIYNKGYQFRTKENILRLEVKVFKMQFLNTHGIPLNTLADLRNIDVLRALGALLVRIIGESVWTDYKLANSTELTEQERLLMANGSNPTYWENLKPTVSTAPDYSKNRKAYYREMGRFEKLVAKYGNDLKGEIVGKSRDKFTDLLQVAKTQKGTNLPCRYSVRLSSSKYCPVTLLDISMQTSRSRFLTGKGVAYYYKHFPEIYEVLEKRLSAKWKYEPLEVQFEEIAHSVRNEFSNPRNNYKRSERKRGAKLFDDRPYFNERLKISMYGTI